MAIDIKALRERAEPKISQKELAVRIGKTQSQVSRYEENPEKIPLDVMVQICLALGVDMVTVINGFSNSDPEGIDAGEPYSELFKDVGYLQEYCSKSQLEVGKIGQDLLEALNGLLEEFSRKPRLMMVGAFDSGKSTIANALLGTKDLPTKYQPATKTVTYIRHLEDKPSWLSEEVLILSADFNPLQWRDEKHCMGHKIAAGNATTLKEYGTHYGAKASKEAAYALVFLDAPLLHSCEIVDLPGFENSTTDSEKAKSHLVQADIVVFVCPYISFMGASDIVRLSEVLRGMPHFCSEDEGVKPLSNLFIVASHTSISVSDEDLKDLIQNCCKRIEAQFSEFAIPASDGTDIKLTAELLSSRVFTFFYEISYRRCKLEKSVTSLLSSTFPVLWKNKADQEIIAFKNTNRDRLEAQLLQYEQATRDNKDKVETIKKIAQKSRELVDKAMAMRERILDNIRRRYFPDSLKIANEVYAEFCSVKFIQGIIKRSGYNSKAEAKEYAPGLIWEHMYSRISKGIGKVAETFTVNEITPYIEMYEQAASSLGSSLIGEATPVQFSSFNAQGAFLGGLTGLGVVGALSIWAASLGNLGAYIIAAKLGTVLAALGISIGGGTATLVSAMAALGGPAGIAVGIVIIGALLGLALFKSWERKLAEGIVKQIEKKETQISIHQNIQKYWKDTENAFLAGADNLAKQWKAHTDELQAIYKEQAEINSKITNARIVRDFIAGIPWKRSTTNNTEGL